MMTSYPTFQSNSNNNHTNGFNNNNNNNDMSNQNEVQQSLHSNNNNDNHKNYPQHNNNDNDNYNDEEDTKFNTNLRSFNVHNKDENINEWKNSIQQALDVARNTPRYRPLSANDLQHRLGNANNIGKQVLNARLQRIHTNTPQVKKGQSLLCPHQPDFVPTKINFNARLNHVDEDINMS